MLFKGIFEDDFSDCRWWSEDLGVVRRDQPRALSLRRLFRQAWLQGFVVGGDQGYIGVFRVSAKAQAYARGSGFPSLNPKP